MNVSFSYAARTWGIYAVLVLMCLLFMSGASGSVILTIPGIRCVEAGMILGEIGDIHRFSDYHKLLAYAGLDPVIRQSGKFNASHTRMSKRGSRTLRYALVYSAHNVVKNNEHSVNITTLSALRDAVIMPPLVIALVSSFG